MKKFIAAISILFLIGGSVIAQNNEEAEDWSVLKEQGTKVLGEAAKFLQALGKQAEESISKGLGELTKIQCYGKWVYKGESNAKTTLTIEEDGKFTLVQKKGLESYSFSGTCTGTSRFLNVVITDSSHKNFFKTTSSKDQLKVPVVYSVSQDGLTCTFTITGLSLVLDKKTDFEESVVFSKEE